MAINYVALKAELQNDPSALGYAAFGGADWQIADAMNAISTGITVFRGRIDGAEIVGATTASEYLALSAAQQNLYNALTGASGGVDTSSSLVRAAFSAMFGAGTATRTALVALAQRNGSRAEQLFGQSVSDRDIAKARVS